MLYKLVLIFEIVDEIVKCDHSNAWKLLSSTLPCYCLICCTRRFQVLSVTIYLKATEQYFPVALFIMLYKVVMNSVTVDEVLVISLSVVWLFDCYSKSCSLLCFHGIFVLLLILSRSGNPDQKCFKFVHDLVGKSLPTSGQSNSSLIFTKIRRWFIFLRGECLILHRGHTSRAVFCYISRDFIHN